MSLIDFAFLAISKIKQHEQQIADKKLAKEKEEAEERENERKLMSQRHQWDSLGLGANWRENIGVKFLKSLGWTDNNTLEKIAKENSPEEDGHVKVNFEDPKYQAIREYSNTLGKCKTSSIPSDGIELVRVLAKDRLLPRKYSLSTTDVTKFVDNRVEVDDEYSQNLHFQVKEKQKKIKESMLEDFEISKRHFNTWDNFWGRPGHGAPLSVTKKPRLDNLLYPQTS